MPNLKGVSMCVRVLSSLDGGDLGMLTEVRLLKNESVENKTWTKSRSPSSCEWLFRSFRI